MSTIQSNPVELILKNTTERIDILLCDANGDPIDATDGPELTVTNMGDTVIHRDKYPIFTLTGTLTIAAGTAAVTGTGTLFTEELVEGDTITVNTEAHVVQTISNNTVMVLATVHTLGATNDTATKPTRIVKPAATTGSYYILWGDSTAPANSSSSGQQETNQAGDVIFSWSVTGASGSEQVSVVQLTKVVSARTMALLPNFRLLIDKSAKLVNDDPVNPCFLGYTDSQLIQYLQDGLSIINAYEPYPTFCTLDDFPSQTFRHILYEASLLAGVMSQQLFAIDTDIPSFNDQGNTFVIQHGPQLAQVLNTVSQRLDKLIPLMKLKFVRSGALHVEAGTNFRLSTILNAAPSGSTFRNVFFVG